MTDTLIESKQADGFKTESPIRAFTDFQIAGSYAIGKGFRPSMGHLTRYLDAMLAKEGWAVIQIILPRDSHSDPTILFEKGLPAFEDLGLAEAKMRNHPDGRMELKIDDPINPKYYDGKACAEIIEYMPFNVGVAGKYCWRLGEKDPEEQECGKAVWYLKREIVLHTQGVAPRPVFVLPISAVPWYRNMAEERIAARIMPSWRKSIMRNLVQYAMNGSTHWLELAIEGFQTGDTLDLGEGQKP